MKVLFVVVKWWLVFLFSIMRIMLDEADVSKWVVIFMRLFGWMAKKYAKRINSPPM